MKVNVSNIEIDENGLLHASVGDEAVIVDVPRFPELQAIIDQLNDDLRGRIESAGRDNCDQCVGTCCTNNWQIHTSHADAQRLAVGLELTTKVVLLRYMTPAYNHTNPDRRYMLRMVKDKRFESGQRCHFLKVTKNADGIWVGRCGVYEHRPDTCREYPAHNCDHFIPANRLVRHRAGPVVDDK